ncbi:MAG: urease accessory protein UreG [Actinomycetales bacterium]|nr:urease accessory protein UreG [Actinomycetales bacterium]
MRRLAGHPDPDPAPGIGPGTSAATDPPVPRDPGRDPAGRGDRVTSSRPGTPLRVGVAGRTGSGKTALIAALCRVMADRMSVAVVTNEVAMPRDADTLRSSGVIPGERVAPVFTEPAGGGTGGEDLEANFEAVDELVSRLFPLDLVLVEAAGDDLDASFGEELVDLRVLVLDATHGERILLGTDLGVLGADLLVVTKADLARREGIAPAWLEAIAHRVAGDAPVIVLSLREDPGAAEVVTWLLEQAARWRAGAPVPA